MKELDVSTTEMLSRRDHGVGEYNSLKTKTDFAIVYLHAVFAKNHITSAHRNANGFLTRELCALFGVSLERTKSATLRTAFHYAPHFIFSSCNCDALYVFKEKESFFFFSKATSYSTVYDLLIVKKNLLLYAFCDIRSNLQ